MDGQAVSAGEKVPNLVDGAVVIVTQLGTGLQADVAINPIRLVVDRAQQVSSPPDIFHHQCLVNLFQRFIRIHQMTQLLVVVLAASDSLFKDGRVRRDAAQAFLDQRL